MMEGDKVGAFHRPVFGRVDTLPNKEGEGGVRGGRKGLRC